ncbi:MAG: disulfide bond formation protein B [Deltaproteobacteria bacterium]|nr:disulfide bond formation protein B [Deltaproteobacteria bacterium]
MSDAGPGQADGRDPSGGPLGAGDPGAPGLLGRIAGLPDRLLDDFWGTLKLWQDGRGLWFLGGLSALGLELFSYLYFQRRLGLSPCEYCVLIRSAMLVIFLGGMTGAVLPRSLLFKLPGLALALAGAVVGLRWSVILEGINLAAAMDPDFLPVCRSGRVEFPLGIPLDLWLPGHFSPGGECGLDSAWLFWGFSMTQWLIMIYTVYIVGLLMMAASMFVPGKPGPAGGRA